MPKKSFFLLPAAHQDAFIDQALSHFANTPYHQASLSALLRQCDMAKGTFYLYFAHKQDLYEYLVETVLSMKKVYVRSRLVRTPADFFQLFESLLRLETTFRLEHPLFENLLSLALDSRFSPFPPEKIRQLHVERDQQFYDMMIRDQLRGRIATDADAQIISFLSGLMLEEFHRLVRQQMDNKKAAPQEVTADCTRRFMTLFRRALSAQPR